MRGNASEANQSPGDRTLRHAVTPVAVHFADAGIVGGNLRNQCFFCILIEATSASKRRRKPWK